MKKIISILLIVFSFAQTVSAQLKIDSQGNALMGTKLTLNGVNYTAKMESGISASSGNLVALLGYSQLQSSNSQACGVYGRGQNDYNTAYGVVGTINAASNGAGVAGSPAAWASYSLQGKYAGYFLGDALVAGTMTVGSLVQSSDIRLKENIQSLNKRDDYTLDKVLGMNVVEYTYKDRLPSVILPDSVSEKEVLEAIGHKTGKKHIGLIAQELQKLYPELVEEMQDGYLAVNYMELVPVLIQAIQELKQELDEVKGENGQSARKLANTTSITDAQAKGNVLYQNSPNPFKEQTTIRFQLADDAQNAAICIFDMTGKMLKKLPVSVGMESVSVAGYELGEGMFLYTLIVSGTEIDTKRMIVTK